MRVYVCVSVKLVRGRGVIRESCDVARSASSRERVRNLTRDAHFHAFSRSSLPYHLSAHAQFVPLCSPMHDIISPR